MIALLWLAGLVATLVLYLRKVYSRFSDYGVKNLKPVPIMGNAAGMTLKKRHVSEDFQMLYDAFPTER